MYYLLNEHTNCDRRIITEEHPVVQQHIKDAVNEEWKNPDKMIKWLWGYENKSENLLNLLEKDDLVELDKGFYKIFAVENILGGRYIGISDDKQHLHRIGTYNNKIKAIYKPNSKGDYILAWKRDEQ